MCSVLFSFLLSFFFSLVCFSLMCRSQMKGDGREKILNGNLKQKPIWKFHTKTLKTDMSNEEQISQTENDLGKHWINETFIVLITNQQRCWFSRGAHIMIIFFNFSNIFLNTCTRSIICLFETRVRENWKSYRSKYKKKCLQRSLQTCYLIQFCGTLQSFSTLYFTHFIILLSMCEKIGEEKWMSCSSVSRISFSNLFHSSALI